MNSFPRFESVYDWVPGFGRTKSVSYRMWRGARALAVYRPLSDFTETLYKGVSLKAVKRRFKFAVAQLRKLR